MIIYCDKCKRDIGKISIEHGLVIYSEENANGLLSVRMRMDGQLGFQCDCGNYSIVSEAENGIKLTKRIKQKDIDTITARLKANPTKVKIDGKHKKVDGFTIKED